MGAKYGYNCEDNFQSYKKYALKAAKELGYSKSTIKKIKAAKYENEIQRIMITERHKQLN